MSETAPMEEQAQPGMLRSCAIAAAIIVLALALLLAKCRADDAHPSDDAIAREFAERQASYTELRDMMLEEETVTRVGRDFIWIDDMTNVPDAERARYLPDERFARYRALFDTLDLEDGVVRYRDGSVGFLRSSSGIVPAGSGKRILWTTQLAGPLIEEGDGDTDAQPCEGGSPCSSFRQLAPEWYLAFDSS